jgi:hypothetical protein
MANVVRGLVGLLLAIPLVWAPALATDHTWLVGTWELSHDPEGNPKDWLEFTADGTTTSISPSGRRTPGEYTVVNGTVNVVYTFKGQRIPLALTYSTDKKTLLVRSPKTGSTSEYRKTP